jgi:hypothetical protein
VTLISHLSLDHLWSPTDPHVFLGIHISKFDFPCQILDACSWARVNMNGKEFSRLSKPLFLRNGTIQVRIGQIVITLGADYKGFHNRRSMDLAQSLPVYTLLLINSKSLTPPRIWRIPPLLQTHRTLPSFKKHLLVYGYVAKFCVLAKQSST